MLLEYAALIAQDMRARLLASLCNRTRAFPQHLLPGPEYYQCGLLIYLQRRAYSRSGVVPQITIMDPLLQFTNYKLKPLHPLWYERIASPPRGPSIRIFRASVVMWRRVSCHATIRSLERGYKHGSRDTDLPCCRLP